MTLTQTQHTPVLIIGGGIVGLSASLLLAHHGISSILVERHPSTSIHPRARSVNMRVMELYRSIGIAEAIREAGESISHSVGIFPGESLKKMVENKPRKEGKRSFPLMGLFSGIGPEAGQFVTQDMMEPVLLRVAKERGVDARFNTECLSVEQDEEKVTASLKNRTDESTYQISADYMIAADGANSPIREQLRIPRSGKGTLGNFLNILFHTTPSLEDLVKGREPSMLIVDRPDVTGALTSINNSDRWVFHLLYTPADNETPADFPTTRCEALLHTVLGLTADEVKIDIKSILPWQASVRIASQFQAKRIFLAGDAAHQMPPYAGQGSTSGIADVHNLAWKLAFVLKKLAPSSLLDTYEVERLPVDTYAAEASAGMSDERGLYRLKKDFRTVTSIAKIAGIIAGFGYFYDSKAIIQESTWPLNGWSWKAWSIPSFSLGLDGRPGSRCPHVWVQKAGKRISTTDLLGKQFVLLTGGDGHEWCEAVKALDDERLVAHKIGPGQEIDVPAGMWESAAGISSTGALLVRPDGFVAWRERRQPADLESRIREVMKVLTGAA